MNVINFARCKYVIRRQTTWSYPTKVISEETRSGINKTRMAHTAAPKTFNVTLLMDAENAEIFDNWFENSDLSGLYPFYLKQIDRVDGQTRVYRFAKDTNIDWTNVGGKMLEATFSLEEVL